MASSGEERCEEARLQIIRIIEASPHVTTRQIADRLRISNGSAHYVLKALIDNGFIKAESLSRSACKRRYVYVLTPAGLNEKLHFTYDFIKRKRQEFDALKDELGTLEDEIQFSSASCDRKSKP